MEDNKIVKTGRGGKYNFPSTVEPEDPSVVVEALQDCLYWYDKGSVSKAVTDDEIETRTREYFERCLNRGERPTVESYALALGYTRQSLNEWEHGKNASARKVDIIKRAKEFLASYDARMVTAGKLNPVPYIFRAKNYYGMKDQVDIIATPGGTLADVPADEIVNKYKELPE